MHLNCHANNLVLQSDKEEKNKNMEIRSKIWVQSTVLGEKRSGAQPGGSKWQNARRHVIYGKTIHKGAHMPHALLSPEDLEIASLTQRNWMLPPS